MQFPRDYPQLDIVRGKLAHSKEFYILGRALFSLSRAGGRRRNVIKGAGLPLGEDLLDIAGIDDVQEADLQMMAMLNCRKIQTLAGLPSAESKEVGWRRRLPVITCFRTSAAVIL